MGIAEAYAQDIPGAQKVIIEKCDHVAQLERPAEFNAALLRFLEGSPTAQTKK